MKFNETFIKDLILVEPYLYEDNREGFMNLTIKKNLLNTLTLTLSRKIFRNPKGCD